MVETIVKFLAGIGAFMMGFKILSENMEKLANKGLNKLFDKVGKNRFAGVGIGAFATALVQSSAATTVLVVGLVNSGIIDLFQATTVIMGANIGTTITAQIAALSSFDMSIYLLLLSFIGVFVNMIAKKDKGKTIGMAIAGMGLLFLGMQYMKNAMVGFSESETISNALEAIKNPFLLLLFGAAATALVQSSAAITTIIISMVAAGIMIGGSSGNGVLFVVLGTNIGTCVTALISSIGTNANARRSSLIHLLFNVFGSLLFTVILLIFPSFKAHTFDVWFPNLPATQIAMFHTFFNVICTAIFLPFPGIFVKISKLLIKDKKVKKAPIELEFMDERMLQYPSVALGMLSKEITNMSYKAIQALNLAVNSFFDKDDRRDEIEEINTNLTHTNAAVIEYLVKIAAKKISYAEECTVSAYHHNLNDVLRIGEIADNIAKYTQQRIKEELEFSDKVIVEIGQMTEKINEMYKLVEADFMARNKALKPEIDKIEESIDAMRADLVNGHLERLKAGTCQPQSSGVFINLVNNLERAADHLTYISDSIE